MSHYIHDLPGRLRIQSENLRAHPVRAHRAQDELLALDGVTHVRLNPRAGSVTVQYDPARIQRRELLATLDAHGCLPRQAATDRVRGTGQAGELFGKALAGALVNKLAERSALKLVSVLL